MKTRTVRLGVSMFALVWIVGCSDRPTLMPNSDPSLNRTRSSLATDAVETLPVPGRASTRATSRCPSVPRSATGTTRSAW